jgi:hypothetical protein
MTLGLNWNRDCNDKEENGTRTIRVSSLLNHNLQKIHWLLSVQERLGNSGLGTPHLNK